VLEKIDLKKKIGKAAYHARLSALEAALGTLQREARDRAVPVCIVFEGLDAAGKGAFLNRLILAMDPRGFNVYSMKPPTEEEALRPFLWRFWVRTPEKGRIALFDRSWCAGVVAARVGRSMKKKAAAGAYASINAFERQLVQGGTTIVKFFLHVSKKEQKRRFEKYESNPSTAWKVTKEDWKRHKEYGRFVAAYEEMLEETDTASAPWTVVGSDDIRSATLTVFSTVDAALQRAVAGARRDAAGARVARPAPARRKRLLDKADLSLAVARPEYEKKLEKYRRRMWELEHEVYLKRLPVAIVFEGWDAAGKGGAIRRLAQGMDPRGYEVVPFAAPNDVEKRHHYLWRFWKALPKAGHITIFDRSWYGRVLVERVEGFCTEEEWRRAYREINETEAQWADFGMVIVKFWLHIDEREQLARFNARQKDPAKRWKITDEDWRNRSKWAAYQKAVDEMIDRTDTPRAPWTIVEANSKTYARIKVLKTVIHAIERAL
jgi:polyphosphate:AMP phosphotransferase